MMNIRKSKKEIAKTILKGLLLAGAIAVASTSPYFVTRVLPAVIKHYRHKRNKKDKKVFYDTFYRLKRQGLIKMEYRGAQLYISLTKEGKKLAGKYQIDDLEIKKPKKWDKIWRVLVFDIKEKHKIKREALRGKLKELGLFMLQKSVWVCPYDFRREMEVLRSFFNFTKSEMTVITASNIENNQALKIFFNLK